ncbi:MAG: signal recognition particle-docking protein FtsY [Desulfobacteraceae bacterium]|nr:signal recognition particle-docking protein FtsY [Desulfobacteraceae bacterium]
MLAGGELTWIIIAAAAAALVIIIILLFLFFRRKQKKTAPKEPAETRRAEQQAVEPPEVEPGTVTPKTHGLMDRLKSGLGKTRHSLTQRLENAVSEKGVLDPEALEDIEEALITADVGIETTTELIRKIRENGPGISNFDELRSFLKQEIAKVFKNLEEPKPAGRKPHVIMVVGVNGVGKTTTIGKLAHRFRGEGQSVLVGAADTFRAAAVEQLGIWAERAGAQMVSHRENADPAAVAYDAVEAAISRDIDRVIIDTAGRLHTKTNLMEQLKKIKRSISKKIPDAPHEVLLVLDATTGQNAVSQAKMFHEGTGVNGLVLTKLDGTAKGGIVVAICSTMKLPVSYIGVGESIEDLQPFDPDRFVEALF